MNEFPELSWSRCIADDLGHANRYDGCAVNVTACEPSMTPDAVDSRNAVRL